MKKEVYNKNIPHFAGNHGLFEYENFLRFMNILENAELVHTSCDLYGDYFSAVYHIEPKEATLKYDKWSNVDGNGVKVTLYGSIKSLSEIEKKILEKDKEFLKI